MEKTLSCLDEMVKLAGYLDGKGETKPLLVVYGTKAADGINLDFCLTDSYEASDDQLKRDVTEAVGKIYQQMKG